MTKSEHLQRMRRLRTDEGDRAVLIYLNGLTDHRFTAMYRFDDETLRSLHFYDRENPEVETCPEIPVTASYCVFVRSAQKRFATEDSLADARAVGHPKRLEIRSYCGVPLVDDTGRVFGSICHFDPRPMPISDDNVELMEAVAAILSGFRSATSV